MPLVFGSDTTGATLWCHRFWDPDPSARYVEIKHVDGAVAVFERAQTIGTLDAWRLQQVIDPYDNEADYLYDANSGRLSQVRYPSGIWEAVAGMALPDLAADRGEESGADENCEFDHVISGLLTEALRAESRIWRERIGRGILKWR
jgi:hypothetical protein